MPDTNNIGMGNRTDVEELANIEDLSWYHGNMSRHIAEALLMANGIEGSFLLRDSTPVGKIYCVSVRAKDSVKHFKVERDGSMYSFGIAEFDSFEHLKTHFANQPILCGNAGTMGLNFELGTLVTLKYPYPARVEEPDWFDKIQMHSTMSLEATGRDLDLKLKATPLATKAGFLTKQGGTVKSWKHRWFVCIRSQLKYFEDRNDDKAIHTINLNECNNCYKSEIPGKCHCFSLDFRERTWNFSAQSEDELNEWVTLIKWKLDHKE